MYWALLLAETRTFVEILQAEWLGALASAFVLFSFLTRNQTRIRLINMVGCIIFVVYGCLLPSYSTAFMNASLLIVHTVYLVKDYLKTKKGKAEQQQANTEDEAAAAVQTTVDED